MTPPPTRSDVLDDPSRDPSVDEQIEVLDIVLEPEERPDRSGRLPFFPALDGIRGIAVVAVLLFHAGFNLAGEVGQRDVPGGFLGVSTFFTLSGFLITSLLLGEHRDTAHVDLTTFWFRRFRRLMPAAMVAIAIAILFGWLVATPAQLSNLRGDVFSSVFDVANWHFIVENGSLNQAVQTPSPLLQFWSIAIEEQFYLLFPLLVSWVVVSFSRPRRVLLWMLIAGTVVSVALAVAADLPTDRMYFGSDTRAAEILIGALLAVALFDRRVTAALARGRAARSLVGLGGVAALVITLFLWGTTRQQSDWVFSGGLAAYALVSAALLLAAILPGNPVHFLLGLGPLRWLGRISYGLYLYHWPVFLWIDAEAPSMAYWPQFTLKVAISFALAIASYHLLEMPIRRGDRVLRMRSVMLAPIAAFAVLLAALFITSSEGASNLDLTGEETARPGPAALEDEAGTEAGGRPLTPEERAILEGKKPPTKRGGEGEGSGEGTGTGTGTGSGNNGTGRPTTPTTNALPVTTDPGEGGPDPVPSTTPDSSPPNTGVPTPDRALRVLVVGDSSAAAIGDGLRTWGSETRLFDVTVAAEPSCGIGRFADLRRDYNLDPFLDLPIPLDCKTWPTHWADLLVEHDPDIVVMHNVVWDATEHLYGGNTHTPGEGEQNDRLQAEFIEAARLLTSTGAELMWLDNAPIQWGRERVPPPELPVNDPVRMDWLNYLYFEVATQVPNVRLIPFAAEMAKAPGGVLDAGMRPDGINLDSDSARAFASWLGPTIIVHWSQDHPEGT